MCAPAGQSRSVALCAKAKKKKSKAPKTSGMEWARNFVVMPYDSTSLREVASVACATFAGRSGKALHASLKSAADVPKALWSAPAAVVVVRNGTFVYANAAACEAWNQTHSALIGSKTVLSDALPKAFESNYEKKDAFFTINAATRWLIEKPVVQDGALRTQALGAAYAFFSWTLLDDGTICEPGGIRTKPAPAPTAIEDAIATQAALVRSLKETSGKTNKDPEVLAAVAELLRLKEQLVAVNSAVEE